MPGYEIFIKNIEPLKVVSVRGVVPKPPDQDLLWNELGAYLAQQRIHPKGAGLALYHGMKGDWDIEVCQQIAEDPAPTPRINVCSLPGVETMACVIHTGPLVKIGAAHDALLQWLERSVPGSLYPCRLPGWEPERPEYEDGDPVSGGGGR